MSNPEKDQPLFTPGQPHPPDDTATAHFTPEEIEADPVLQAYAEGHPHLTDCDKQGIVNLIVHILENAEPTADPEP